VFTYLSSQETANGEGGSVLDSLASLVNVSKSNLDGSVILGSDQSVGGRATTHSVNIYISLIID